eukprot:gb/GECH01011949.1/.p1 GENE.gb/GECH01011949.1/~~gb/GECH01011949.1/.p1  ORF type:complete len:457 (+),score=124.32 gb/GECH01011949.1/:1-1371(+)
MSLWSPPTSMFKKNRERFLSILRDANESNSAVCLQSGGESLRYTTDVEEQFRQESNFYYVCGCNDVDTQCALNVSTGEIVLFVPKRGDDYTMWAGQPPSNKWYQESTGVDRVLYVGEMNSVLKNWNIKRVLSLEDRKPEDLDSSFELDTKGLRPLLTQSRLVKNEDEFEAMRKTAAINNEAHKTLMREIACGLREYQCEAIFKQKCMFLGARHQAYAGIYGTGKNGAVLHYGAGDVELKDGDLILVDAGCEFNLFASDVTRTYPVNGKFTAEQKEIYNIVLRSQQAVLDALKPGVEWEDMHYLAEKVIAEGMLKSGFLKGDLNDILENRITAIFFPHGLGHSIGLDVHDPPNRDGSFTPIDKDGIRNLRCRIRVEANMAMTIEPGVYFVPKFINDARNDPQKAKFLNFDKIDKYMDFGGIRLEDDVIVRNDGIENLSADVPKEIDAVEKLLAEGGK